jgi:nucleotide-binding universal stress UspA family protein
VRQARLEDTPIEAVTAWQYPIIYGWALPSTEDYDHRHIAQTMLSGVFADVAGSDPTVEIHDRVVAGHAVRVLLDAARDAQLLVLGHVAATRAGRSARSASARTTRPVPFFRR